MKYLLILISLVAGSCRIVMDKPVEGNGVMKSETKTISDFTKIDVAGSFDVDVQPSNTFKVTVSADENLLDYIKIRKEGNELKIEEKDGFNLKSEKGIRVTVEMPVLGSVSVSGSGSVKALKKMENTDRMEVSIGGSGSAELELKCPEVRLRIGGSGDATLSGSTKTFDISIGGSGNCQAEKLLSEECKIRIGGSGTARVYASMSLDASIGGSGDVFYAGHPQNVHKSISGGGSIEKVK